MTLFKKVYGENPLHLIVMLGCIALGLYAVDVTGLPVFYNQSVWWQSIAVWFIGAFIVHDFILYPIYALADRTGSAVFGRIKPSGISPLNYVRLPVMGTALTFILFFPGIISQGGETYTAATGLTQEPFLVRWLWLVVAMFLVSGIIYAVRVFTSRQPALVGATSAQAAPDQPALVGPAADHNAPPAEAAPVESAPVESASAESASDAAETEPAEPAPVESASAESAPVESEPAPVAAEPAAAETTWIEPASSHVEPAEAEPAQAKAAPAEPEDEPKARSASAEVAVTHE